MSILGRILKPLGNLIRLSGTRDFRGKQRLIKIWRESRQDGEYGIRTIHDSGKLKCDLSIPYEAMIWLHQEEEKELEVLTSLLGPNDIFIDCGANIGLWTIAAAIEVGHNGTVYSFEPNPKTFNKLCKNINYSNLKNIKPKQIALGNQHDTVFLRCEKDHNLSKTVKEGSMRHDVEVFQKKLDSICSDTSITGCKIDVEGQELSVLKGARSILKEYHPWLCVEFNTNLTETNCIGNWRVHNFLTNLGYSANRFCYPHEDPIEENWETNGYTNLLYRYR